MRTTEFAEANPDAQEVALGPAPELSSYGPPEVVHTARMGCLPGSDFLLQTDGTLRCPAGSSLYPQERRPQRDGTLRVVYAARIGHCRPCPLRECCQWHGTQTKNPRRVSAVLHPQS